MPRGIKATVEDVVIDEKTDISVFKSAIIDLGTKLCLDVQEGRAKEPVATLEQIANLYNAIK